MDWSGNLKQNQGLLALNRIELEDKKETKHDLLLIVKTPKYDNPERAFSCSFFTSLILESQSCNKFYQLKKSYDTITWSINCQNHR
jgi:hypothetical protein